MNNVELGLRSNNTYFVPLYVSYYGFFYNTDKLYSRAYIVIHTTNYDV
jgi:ABC-type glycerol-3-phosphate transport system substrate-binding protein